METMLVKIKGFMKKPEVAGSALAYLIMVALLTPYHNPLYVQLLEPALFLIGFLVVRSTFEKKTAKIRFCAFGVAIVGMVVMSVLPISTPDKFLFGGPFTGMLFSMIFIWIASIFRK